jgi:hypothetical protein
LSVGLIWFIAVTTNVILDLAIPNIQEVLLSNIYIYAIPASCIVAIVFNSIWGKKWINGILVSALIWTLTLSLFLTLRPYLDKMYELFIIAIPLQVLTILFFLIESRKKLKEKK